MNRSKKMAEILFCKINYNGFKTFVFKKTKSRFYYTLQISDNNFNLIVTLWSDTGTDLNLTNVVKVSQWINNDWVDVPLDDTFPYRRIINHSLVLLAKLREDSKAA